jgi:hypothetical protein
MREIRTYGATSGDWKRNYDLWTEAPARPPLSTVVETAPVVDSTLIRCYFPESRSAVDQFTFHVPGDYLKAATRAACSRMTRALSSSAVPAGSPLTLTNGLDHTGRRGQPPQLSL